MFVSNFVLIFEYFLSLVNTYHCLIEFLYFSSSPQREKYENIKIKINLQKKLRWTKNLAYFLWNFVTFLLTICGVNYELSWLVIKEAYDRHPNKECFYHKTLLYGGCNEDV